METLFPAQLPPRGQSLSQPPRLFFPSFIRTLIIAFFFSQQSRTHENCVPVYSFHSRHFHVVETHHDNRLRHGGHDGAVSAQKRLVHDRRRDNDFVSSLHLEQQQQPSIMGILHVKASITRTMANSRRLSLADRPATFQARRNSSAPDGSSDCSLPQGPGVQISQDDS